MLKNQLIDRALLFLAKSDIGIHFPKYNKLKYQKNGAKHVYISPENDLWKSQFSDNLLLHVLVFYGLIEVYFEEKYPELRGQDYIAKYKNISDDNDIDVIMKEIYRCLNIFRNTALLPVNKSIMIEEETGIIEVDYELNGVNFLLKMQKIALELIYTVVLYVLKEERFPKNYKEGILRTFYDDMLDNIFNIKDDFSGDFADISSAFRLKRKTRYQVLQPEIDIKENALKIEKIKDNEFIVETSGLDYMVFHRRNRYVIPDEIVKENQFMNFDELESWKLKKKEE